MEIVVACRWFNAATSAGQSSGNVGDQVLKLLDRDRNDLM